MCQPLDLLYHIRFGNQAVKTDMAGIRPPFNIRTAHEKVKAAQALWNTRDPSAVIKAYTADCIWRNRSTFLKGHDEIHAFLTAKWKRELDYRLRKELFTFDSLLSDGGVDDMSLASKTREDRRIGNKIAVQFWYEYRDGEDGEKWKRCYGIEHWTFDKDGKMEKRMMSGNDVEIGEQGRWFRESIDVDTVELGERDF